MKIRQVVIDMPKKFKGSIRVRFIEVSGNVYTRPETKVVEQFISGTILSASAEMRQWLEKGEMTE